MVGVWQGGSQIDRSCSVLHCVVQELDFAGPCSSLRVRWQPNHSLQSSARHLFLDFWKIPLRNGEVRVDRIQVLNQKKGCAVRLHNVSDVDQAGSSSAINRRVNVAILEI